MVLANEAIIDIKAYYVLNDAANENQEKLVKQINWLKKELNKNKETDVKSTNLLQKELDLFKKDLEETKEKLKRRVKKRILENNLLE
jgi:hypothetical protein